MSETIIGEKYKIIRLLGEGGMGMVYEAENTWTERRVALKVIRQEQLEGDKAIARFLLEGRLAARVSHPNIVEILDMGQDSRHGVLFLVQEFLKGISLRHYLSRKRRLRVLESLDLMVPIMGALVAAHEQGIVHRDVKPDNVILAKVGPNQLAPKLIDFGISTLLASAERQRRSSSNKIITGTPAYMAPEQFYGAESIDARADVWAVGAVLYETFTGRGPYLAESITEFIDMIREEEPPPIRDLASHVPKDLAQVIHKALTRELRERYSGMRWFLEDILMCPSLASDLPEKSLLWRHRGSIPYQRQHERYDVDWQVSLKCPAWESAQDLLAANVSRGGIFVVTDQVLAIGESLEVLVELPDDVTLRFLGTVQHVVTKEQSSPEMQPGMGIKFDNQHEVDLIMLEQKASSLLDSSFQAIQYPTMETEYRHQPVEESGQDQKEASPDAYGSTIPSPIGALPLGRVKKPQVAHQETIAAPPPVPAPRRTPASPPAPRRTPASPPAAQETPAASPPAAQETPAASPPAAQRTPAASPPAAQGTPAASPPAAPAASPQSPPARPALSRQVPLPQGPIAEAVGIDFGTSFCSVSLAVGDRVYLISDQKQQRLFPSIVSYPERGVPVVGWKALPWLIHDPARSFTSIKRLIGRKISDPSMPGYVRSLPYKIIEGPGGLILFELDGTPIAPIQVAALIFEYLANIASSQIGKTFTKAVVSVPISFGEPHRAAIKRAAQIAGIEVLELLEEPVAGALAYGYGQNKEELIAVYDFGGGTFDFSVLQLHGNQYKVLGTADAPWLGGDDFDLAIAQDTADIFWKQTDVDLRKRSVEWQRLLFASERAKRTLSTQKATEIQVPGIVERPQKIDLQQPIDQTKFEILCRNAFQVSVDLCAEGLARAGVTHQQIQQVVLSGGISRIPFIQRGLSRFFQREVRPVVSPDEAVCLGTGLQAAIAVKHAVTGAARI